MFLDYRKIEVLLGCLMVVSFSIKFKDDRYKENFIVVIGSLRFFSIYVFTLK